jgi:hypothetical protein
MVFFGSFSSYKIDLQLLKFRPNDGRFFTTGGILPGWWYTYPSEKYEFVNGKDYPIYYGKK